jgi:hypothetical protein
MASAHSPRLQPISPFSNPLHHGNHQPDPQVQQRLKQLEKQYANPDSEPIPVIQADPVWSLEEVVGTGAAKLLEQSGQLGIHIVGDTGFNSYPIRKDATVEFGKVNPTFQREEQNVITAMAKDCDANDIRIGPAFFCHLGDVIYFDNTRPGYASQFYEPFSLYPRKILAIPGNHDCEVMLGHQKHALDAFVENFCQKTPGVPPAARYVSPLREMLAQPGVYWRLDAPFIQIIGLCSNVGETAGALRGGNAGNDQYKWLQKTLGEVAADQKKGGNNRRALVVAVHHPPYSSGNHHGSQKMNDDLDAVFKQAGVWPDAVLAAHDHSYQRFTRTVNGAEIPYIVAGGGGRYTSQQSKTSSSNVPVPGVEPVSSGDGNGYLLLTARPGRVSIEYRPVDNFAQNDKDAVLIDLSTRTLRRP